MEARDCRLYLITPPCIDPASFADELARALDGGDVAALQLRLKGADDDAQRRAADALLPLCKDRDVPLLMNDRPDLAAETGCDGVHIGQEDGDYRQARDTVGDDAIVGVTCHDSRHLAIEAAEQGADYVAFGAFFPTATKEVKSSAPVEILEWWSGLMVVPVVAIGGITVENCPPLVRAGADFLAVVSAVWDHPEDPAAAVRAFNDSIQGAA
jgi:thiamine-phosphate pyrophosphorylase